MGIGTTTPASALQVSGGVTFGVASTGSASALPATKFLLTNDTPLAGIYRSGMYFTNPAYGYGGLVIDHNDTYGNQPWIDGSSDMLKCMIGGGTSFVVTKYLGQVGLGKQPAYQLDMSTDGARTLTTTTWLTGSDARVKEDIEPANLDICYDTVKAIPLKRFAWKEDFAPANVQDDRHVLGWIAQDVEQVFAKAVTSKAEYGLDDFKTLNTDQLVKALWGAVQKLIADKEILEAQVASLLA